MSKQTIWKQRLIALVAGIALIITVVGTATGVSNSLAELVTPDAPAIACNSTGSGGGSC